MTLLPLPYCTAQSEVPSEASMFSWFSDPDAHVDPVLW
jgi:hypothetical protein